MNFLRSREKISKNKLDFLRNRLKKKTMQHLEESRLPKGVAFIRLHSRR
jgi:hypothetical protein